MEPNTKEDHRTSVEWLRFRAAFYRDLAAKERSPFLADLNRRTAALMDETADSLEQS